MKTISRFRSLALCLAPLCLAMTLSACGGGSDSSSSGSSSSGSSSSGSGSSSSSGSGTVSSSAAITACRNASYNGDKSDIQTYAYDAIAQLDICLYRATNDSAYVTDGRNQCRVLAGLISATNSKFKPLYCPFPY